MVAFPGLAFPMKIVCATELAYPREAFSTLGKVVVLSGHAIAVKDVRDADMLIVRSATRVRRELLEGSSVRFAGTATIGTDHMDIVYLDHAGIRWCYAPGCNANSVSEYVIAALLCLAQRHNFGLENKTIGVIGVGNIGSLVVKKAEALGMRVLQNDLPRQRETEFSVFRPLDELFDQSDIITLHVPLTEGGTDPTFHMANNAFFKRLKKGCVFLNTARGAVVDTDALLQAMDRGTVAHAVIDTWESEPRYRKDLLDRIDLGTPHIAGYSFEGKVMGTIMVYREACRFLGIKPTWTPDRLMPPPATPELHLDAAGRPDEAVLWDAVRGVYDITSDDGKFRESACDDEARRAARFDQLRESYPMRREFRFTRLLLGNAGEQLLQKTSALGFSV